MNLVAIALFIIMAVIFIKFNLVCEVTVNGEKLGYISNKEKFEQSIRDMINQEENNNLYITMANMPEYRLTFIDKTEQTKDEEILAKIEESSEKLYAVTAEKEKETVEKSTIKTAKADSIKQKDNKEKTSKKVTTRGSSSKTTTSKTTLNKAKSSSSTSSKKTTTKVASLNGVKLTVKPVSGVITSRFGSRESIRSSGHSGLDIGAPKGTKIKAAASGTVIFAGYSGGYGNVVKISHGSGIKTYYAHCSKLYVKKGEQVSAGDAIAAVGSTGNSTGNHLHFEVVKNGTSLNPQNYLYK